MCGKKVSIFFCWVDEKRARTANVLRQLHFDITPLTVLFSQKPKYINQSGSKKKFARRNEIPSTAFFVFECECYVSFSHDRMLTYKSFGDHQKHI
jgi:hypothetical protein